MTEATIKHIDTELLPKEGDPKLGYKIFAILKEILDHKNSLGLPGKWTKNYELGKNKHWKSNSKKTLISANLLGAHRQRTVNMLCDNHPTFNVTKLGDPDTVSDEAYDALVHTCEYWWGDQEQQDCLEESVLAGETYGATIEKVVFNPDLEFGLGEVETQIVDPFYFGVYPTKTKKNQKADANLHFWPMSVREARRRWPDHADKIQADSELLKELGDVRQEVAGGAKKGQQGSYFGTIAGVVKNFLNDSGETGTDSDEVLIVECWAKDYSTVSTEILQEDGTVVVETRPKYAGHIRCVTCCNGGKLVLSDRSNPSINPELPDEQAQQTYLYDKFPFSLTVSNKDNVSPWGLSDFEQLDGLQSEVNKSLSQFTLLKDRASRLKIINPRNSGVANDQFTNKPGIINPSNAEVAAGIRYMDPPEIPRDLLEALKVYKDFFYLVSGAFELEQAQTPGREVIAYKAIATLIERASTMLKGKIRNYSKMIRERGRMYVSHVQNWYTEERWISYEQDGEGVSRPVRGEDLIIPAKLTVVSGSTMPRSKVQEREEAIALADKGHIDSEELLKRLDWSGWKEVVQRMQAGPLGEMIDRMAALGMPQEFAGVLQKISQMEDKDFKRALEKGEVPMLPWPQDEGQPDPMGDMQANAEIERLQADIQKVQAEINLILEKANTERVEQQVKIHGVNFDRQKLSIERAQTLSDIEAGHHNRIMAEKSFEAPKAQDGKSYAKNAEETGVTERGLVSNNPAT